MSSKRFSRGRLVQELRDDVERIRNENRFDMGNGTAQLLPRGCDFGMEQLINRAVKYGRLRALEMLADEIESGHAGV